MPTLSAGRVFLHNHLQLGVLNPGVVFGRFLDTLGIEDQCWDSTISERMRVNIEHQFCEDDADFFKPST